METPYFVFMENCVGFSLLVVLNLASLGHVVAHH